MENVIIIEFNLEDYGWLYVYICDREKGIIIPASYILDSINELIISPCMFLEGKSEVLIRFETEPGEYRLRLRSRDEMCIFEVFKFKDTFSRDDIEDGLCVISTQIQTKRLINKFYREIVKLKEIGAEDFKKRWRYDFPQDAFERLIQARKISNI